MRTENTTDEAALPPLPCSALDAALALVDFGPCKTAARPQDWANVAGPMCAHCEGAEDVNLAAARIIAAEYRKALSVIESIEARYIDGEDTHEDWSFMGDCARTYLLSQNVESHLPPPEGEGGQQGKDGSHE